MNTQVDNLYSLPLPTNVRGFFDPIKTREWIHDKAKSAFQKSLNRLESPAYRLKVTDLKLELPEHPPTYQEQNEILMKHKDITNPLRGTFQMIDKKTGKVIDTKTTTIAHIPWITDQNTSVLNGSMYVNQLQQRLKPGVYARRKESGELEAHVNVLPGSGVGGKVIFFPDRALFVYQVGTTQIKLYGLLHDMGVSDGEMEKVWGKEILLKNKEHSDGKELEKFYTKVIGKYEDEQV
jgi:DNA-directed RNA polymerase beta subunit